MSHLQALEGEIAARATQHGVGRYTHLSLGHETVAYSVVEEIPLDQAWWALYYRCHAWLLALGFAPSAIIDEVLGESKRSPLEGRGGSMHLMLTKRVIDVNSIVGGQVPIAVGAGIAARHAGCGEVVVCVLGDGATTCGTTLEAINIAAQQSLPILFVVEDNGLAINTPYRQISRSSVEEKFGGLGVPLLSCHSDSANEVAAAIRQGSQALADGPFAVHVVVRRRGGHHLGAG